MSKPNKPDAPKRRGRPPVELDQFKVARSIRMSPEQWLKLEQLGGVTWIRTKIDAARMD